MAVATQRQKQAYALAEQGASNAEIAEALGCELSTAKGILRKARENLRPNSPAKQNAHLTEKKDPEKGAAALDAATDRTLALGRVRALMRDEGWAPAAINKFIKRMERERNGSRLVARSVRTSDLLDLTTDRLHRILESIDEVDIEEAKLHQKAVAIGILAEKRQLLMGEPTQILRVEEREKLDVLIGVVVREARRRGMVVDSSSEHTQVLDKEGEDLRRGMHHYSAKAIEAQAERLPE